jgi:hypothetical protein
LWWSTTGATGQRRSSTGRPPDHSRLPPWVAGKSDFLRRLPPPTPEFRRGLAWFGHPPPPYFIIILFITLLLLLLLLLNSDIKKLFFK